MRPREKIEQIVKKFDIDINPEKDQQIFDELKEVYAKSQQSKYGISMIDIGRIIMKSKMTKFATVATIILIALFSITSLDKAVSPAWAIEQSIKAQHSVRSIFVKAFQSKGNMGRGESFDFWIKYNSLGKVSQFRMDSPKSADGAKVIVLNDGIAKVWMPDKGTLMLFKGGEITKGLEKLASDFDPKQTLQRLYGLQKKSDETQLITIEPDKDGDPVIFEVVNNEENNYFRYFFDTETKLLIQFEKYQLINGNYELEEKFEFFRYNQFIDDSLFELDDIPDDALILDQALGEVGIEKGDMTDDEAAMEVVRQCLEASISQDYETVKKMVGGRPGNVLEMSYGGRILRIISIDEPVPHEEWKHILYVPCKIEVENKERGNWIANFRPHVKRAENQPGNRWIICGGL